MWLYVFPYLFCAAVWDEREGRIPNFLSFSAMFTGLYFISEPHYALYRLFWLGVLFMIGLFGLIGWGDIKMWMGAVCFIGIVNACVMMLVAYAFLFIVLLASGERAAAAEALIPFINTFSRRKIPVPRTGHTVRFAKYYFLASITVCLVGGLF